MTSVPTIRVVGGIDTHKDLHMAAVVDRDDGRLLETKDFSTTTRRVSGVTPLDASARRARELDDRRAPEPMPSTRCPPRGWMAFERRRHVSRRRRRFLNLLRPRVFLDT